MSEHYIRAELRIVGDDINPDELTDILGVTPTSIALKGDRFGTSSWDYIKTMYGYDLDEAQEEIMGTFSSKKDVLTKIKNSDTQIVVGFAIEIAEGSLPGIFFTNEFLSFVSEIGAVIDIDQYWDY